MPIVSPAAGTCGELRTLRRRAAPVRAPTLDFGRGLDADPQHLNSRTRHLVIAGTLAAIIVVLTAIASPAVADTFDAQRRDAEARAAQATQAAAAIATTIDGLNAQLAQAGLDLQATQARLPIAEAELAAAQQSLERSRREALLIAARLQDAQALQVNLTTTIATNDTRTAQVHTAVGQMARQAYKGETATTGLAVVMGAKSTQDFINEYAMVATALRIQTNALGSLLQAAATNRNDQARLIAVTKKIAALKVEADNKVVQADAAKADAAARQAEIAQLISDQTANQAAIAAMKAQAEAEQAKIDAQRAVIAAELASIIAQQRAAQAAARASTRQVLTGQAVTCTPGTVSGTVNAPAPGASLPASIGPYQGEQIINAAQIIIAANDLGVDEHGQVIAVMTAIGESALINVDHGDAAGPDSRGLFQQRANGAWGSYADRMNPRTAATNFFKALLQVPGWESMPPTLAAHLVQRNADPYFYGPYWNDAVPIVGILGGDPNLKCQ